MAKIKIRDLPKDVKVSKEEMKEIVGGTYCLLSPFYYPSGSNLGSGIKILERHMEELSNAGTESMTNFDNFDTKASSD